MIPTSLGALTWLVGVTSWRCEGLGAWKEGCITAAAAATAFARLKVLSVLSSPQPLHLPSALRPGWHPMPPAWRACCSCHCCFYNHAISNATLSPPPLYCQAGT